MKRALPLLLLVAAAGCGREDPAVMLKRGFDHYAQQDFAAARVDALAVLKLRPDDRQANLLLAQSLLRIGDGEGAQVVIDRLKGMNVPADQIGRMEAEALLARGLPKQAIERIGQDGSAEAWRIVAAARLRLDNAPGALEAFKAGTAAGGSYFLALDYANFLLAGDDLNGATTQLRVMRNYDADALATLMLAARIEDRAGRRSQAHSLLAEAAAKYPNRIEPLLVDAQIYDIEGQTDKAIELVEKASAISPDHPEVFGLKVQLASVKGDWEKVRTLLAPLESQLAPLSANYMAYAEALLRLNHPEQARAMFERAMQLSPHNPYARLMAGEAQLATNDPAKAWETLRPLAQSVLAGPRELELGEKAARGAGDPAADVLAARLKSPQLKQAQELSARGQASLNKRDWKGAIDAYRALLALGADAEVHKRLAFALSNAGDHDAAIAEADRALALEPENADMLYMAGLTRFNAGRDHPEVLRLMGAAVKKDPSSGLFRTGLAKAQSQPA